MKVACRIWGSAISLNKVCVPSFIRAPNILFPQHCGWVPVVSCHLSSYTSGFIDPFAPRLLILCPQIWAYHIALLVAMLILTQLLLAFVLAATVFCITSLSRVTKWFLFSVPPVICSVQTNVISDDVDQTLYDFKFLRVLQMHPHQCPEVILGTAMAMILLLLMWN